MGKVQINNEQGRREVYCVISQWIAAWNPYFQHFLFHIAAVNNEVNNVVDAEWHTAPNGVA